MHEYVVLNGTEGWSCVFGVEQPVLPAGIPAEVTVVRESPSRGVSVHLPVRPPIGASVINGIGGIVRRRKLRKRVRRNFRGILDGGKSVTLDESLVSLPSRLCSSP